MAACECGCGEQTALARETNNRYGHVKGQPFRYVYGHQVRGRVGSSNAMWRGDSASYRTVHGWLLEHYPKTGVCETCGAEGKTQYAFLGERGGYARDRDQYVEECVKCHRRRDA